MLFSVLIANYNNSPYLKTALESVLAQTYPNWEVILVDDCSTDNFAAVMEEYLSDERIKLYHNGRNRGCGYTKRRCASLANGEIMGFLDPDDALQPNALKILCIAHQADPEASIIHSTHYICNQELEPCRIAAYPKALPAGVPYLLLNDGSVHHFASFKKYCYQQTQGIAPDNKKAVDQDLYYLLEETGSIHFIDIPLYYYRIHENSISTMGKEWESTQWHHQVIQEACMRRIQQQKLLKNGNNNWIRKYRTHYYKIAIFRNYRNKRWIPFLSSLFIFPFVGGFGNILSYIAKLPKGGIKMIRRSFHYDHQIKV